MQPHANLCIHTAESPHPCAFIHTLCHTLVLPHTPGHTLPLVFAYPSTCPHVHHTHAHTHTPLPGLVPCPQLWTILPDAMTFSKLMDNVNSKGPFQFLVTVLLGIPILGMANHNLLQIFTAATPAHHCRPPPNASAGPWLLPTGPNGKPEPCLRFAHPPNASLPNDTQGATEPCLDGWVYNISTGNSIVTEVWPQATPRRPLPAGPPHPAALRNGEQAGAQSPKIGGQGTGQAESKDLV